MKLPDDFVVTPLQYVDRVRSQATGAGPTYSRAMTVLRMDNVLLVVDDLEAAKAFFAELGLELEGETVVEGQSVDRLIGLDGVRATIASMRTPDGHGRIELDKFHTRRRRSGQSQKTRR